MKITPPQPLSSHLKYQPKRHKRRKAQDAKEGFYRIYLEKINEKSKGDNNSDIVRGKS